MTDSTTFESKTAKYVTLGCKLNFAETSAIGKSLLQAGIRQALDWEHPDLIVVNTCSVTELADKKCRQIIRRLHREHPNARIIVTGCYAQLKPTEISDIEGVDLVLGTNEKVDLVNYLSALNSANDGMASKVLHTPTGDIRKFTPSVSSEGRTRHFLKVQDGCDYRCSYCTIPKARGRSRNGTITDLVNQAKSVVEEGGKEIVLTGVNVGDFGRSTGDSFLDLLLALDNVQGIERFRISSIEPNLLTEEIIRFVAQSQRFAPHFHLPLQSGSDAVLKLMRRRYKAELFKSRIELIKSILPNAFIGVDVIVGSRGEIPEYFEDSFEFIKGLNISKLHVFSYSERPGTDALLIPYEVDAKDKHRRSQRLLKLSEEKLLQFYTSQVDTRHKVLVEHGETDYLYGFTENYVRVRLPYASDLQGEIVNIQLTGISDNPEVMIGKLM